MFLWTLPGLLCTVDTDQQCDQCTCLSRARANARVPRTLANTGSMETDVSYESVREQVVQTIGIPYTSDEACHHPPALSNQNSHGSILQVPP